MFISTCLHRLVLMGIAGATFCAVPALAQDVTGVWMTDDGEGAVEIRPCGEQRCGRIVWLKQPLDPQGRPMRDGNNPRIEARQRPLCGAQIIEGLKRQSDGSWDGGSIYDPEEGKSYSVALKLLNDQQLQVTGYVGLRSFGETLIWTRSDPHLRRCQVEAITVPRR